MDQVFSFLLGPKHEACGPWKRGRKKRGSITCRTDWANEANKMFIIWFCWLFQFWKGDQELEVRTATYGPGIDQLQHVKSVSHIIKGIMSGYNKQLILIIFAVLPIPRFSRTTTQIQGLSRAWNFLLSIPGFSRTMATLYFMLCTPCMKHSFYWVENLDYW